MIYAPSTIAVAIFLLFVAVTLAIWAVTVTVCVLGVDSLTRNAKSVPAYCPPSLRLTSALQWAADRMWPSRAPA